LEVVALNVSGVRTLDAYGSLQKVLSSVSLIEDFRISKVTGDTVSYQIEIRGGEERLRRALGFAGLLELADAGEFGSLEAPLALEFFYSP
jgi:hypothetical protein